MFELLKTAIDLFLHLDIHLAGLIVSYGAWVYLFVFVVIFLETGLVVTPFLPGDSLLFVAGSFVAQGSFNLLLLFVLFSLAAILGDTLNYWIGHFIGPKVFEKELLSLCYYGCSWQGLYCLFLCPFLNFF